MAVGNIFIGLKTATVMEFGHVELTQLISWENIIAYRRMYTWTSGLPGYSFTKVSKHGDACMA